MLSNFRTRRWAKTPSNASSKTFWDTPRSSNRAAAPLALFVCSVLKTRCPVCAARSAICAVSLSRISPTRITSGS